ncbi:VOC family protein [Myceligenerans pegani]|uniref:VOC family protein n=1 Tax=Myceligenerans pegani TaxID=2776917 RepID=A0ABR9MY45_9MICO|nr:VOC family protein [Myceligenerans sp. TRM 65318]MBE1875981.1 VOC family protein [Myceligenerans sp. TRM 65318]MBE3018252.1 VOC family protein [Myceligenerans sp. TRM 65318]
MTFTISHDHIGISVTAEDLEATVAWYSHSLGLTVESRFDTQGFTFVFLSRDGVRIELMAGGASTRQTWHGNVFGSMDPSRLHHFCLAVDDLDRVIATLGERGVELIGGPITAEAIGRRIAFTADNLGNIIELSEPVAA